MASDDDGPFLLYKYICSYPNCDLQFKRKDRLDSHEYTHHHVKMFPCDVENCDKAYINSSHLKRHKRIAHKKRDEMVACPFESCGKNFATEADMEAHCRDVETHKHRDFECDICNEKFRRKAQLNQHMFQHTHKFRYSCEKCGKGFLEKTRLKRHESSHDTRQCEHCQATFDKWSLLISHKRMQHPNSDLKCSICSREFHSKRSLKAHRTIHACPEDRAVYPCTFEGCTKFFSRNTNMLAHFKSKHEHRKFKCSVEGCPSELSTKQKLELHIKVVHAADREEKPKNIAKPKAQRKDKGTQKVSTASKFFNFILPPKFEQAIIAGQGQSIHLTYDPSTQDEDDDFELNESHSLNDTAASKLTVVEC